MRNDESMKFFGIFLATIIVTRLFLWFLPVQTPDIGSFEVHHYMYGLILIAIALLSRSLPLYGIGVGLVVDELMIFPLAATTIQEYFSPLFLAGTVLWIALVYMYRHTLVRPLQKRAGRR